VDKRATVALKVTLLVAATLLLYVIWHSARWPLVHDPPLMHYIAWLITQGAAPYRDVFDMNFPGTYLIHLAVIQVGGTGDAVWRAFDLLWLGGISAVLWARGRTPRSSGGGPVVCASSPEWRCEQRWPA
jgi:hypothetical protein